MIDPSLARPSGGQAPIGPPGRAARVLRDRQQALRDTIDRAARLPAVAASRRLVSVYDGGHMPTQPDHIFLAHPVAMDGDEAEGSPASPAVDTTATIPVVVLHNPPQAGDLLVATSVGGRWVAERGGDRSTLCVRICGGIAVEGAVVTLSSDQEVIATCTIGADGCCHFPFAGTYEVKVTLSGTVLYDAARTLGGGATTTIVLSAGVDLICCGSLIIPRVLTLTDAEGSTPLIYDPNWYYPMWTGGHAVQRTGAPVTMLTGLCDVGDPSEGPVRICYQMICHSGKEPAFTIQRSWSWVYRKGDLTPIWYQDDTGFVPGELCATAPPPLCGNPLTDVGTFDANPTTTAPFVLTGTPAPALGNATSDPVGGSIVISA